VGLLSSIFKILHPIRAMKRSIKRALIPRPIRRAKWIVGGIANPVDRVGYLARRSVIRTVDKAITPKKGRKSTVRAFPSQALAAAVPASVVVAKDWMSAVPVAMTAIFLLVAPTLATTMAKRGWGAHLLDVRSIRVIQNENFH